MAQLPKSKSLHLQINHVGSQLTPEHTSQLRYLGDDGIWYDWKLHLPQLLAWAFYMDRALENLDGQSIRALPVEGFDTHLADYRKWLKKKFSE